MIYSMSTMAKVYVPVLFSLLLLLSACGAEAASSTTSPAQAPSSEPSAATGTTSAGPSVTISTNQPSASTTTTAQEFVPDYSALVAAVELAMEGTTYEGAALQDPEIFIATAELFCDLLREGMTPEGLLSEYLDRLSDGGAVEVSEDDGLMAGVLLGASIEIVCPEAVSESP